MNDTELDELLNGWKAPEPRDAFRRRLRRRIERKGGPRSRRPFFTRWRLAAAAAVVVLAILTVDFNAFSAKVSPPFTVESKIIQYDVARAGVGPPWYAGLHPESPLITSYNDGGTEVILSWSSLDQPMETAAWKARLALSRAVDRMTDRVLSIAERIGGSYRLVRLGLQKPNLPDQDPDGFGIVYAATVGEGIVVGRREPLLTSGCRPAFRGWSVLGQDVVLGHPVTVAQETGSIQMPDLAGGDNKRVTLWMAPDLSCFALRATVELKQADGRWKLISEKTAVKITLNPDNK